ncbi:SPOR domain-containing protein [Candidatus Endoriftia persephone]|jgi:hypothetical protein|uniref:SPOR domain-containing protein n=3 Tax=Gammaproteobacteria TaxID=1236 RepID=G2FEQ0_9GAMM|nr:SPOR domain-containing protein [Candidatus Endoriftia persephone]EGV50094.1 hypothetical protein Rifp1Sym_ed00040 [endosymbiont of Riftia pachyptila (vent Ph05)]EGW54819.1 hypothetical protein TevJSym_ai00990 [endosymbiont of Tevnia jerichonana (vent Tica)]USF87334.1 SPOR domain-containing protein [Candidatus Endoriftia persephone]
MTRWLFFILLLANIGALIWGYPRMVSDPAPERGAAALGNLKLLSELQEVTEPETGRPAESLDPPAELLPESEPSELAAVDKDEEVEEAQPPVVTVESEPLAEEAAPSPVAEQQVPVAPETPTLAAPAPEQKTPKTPPAPPPPARVCMSVGPLDLQSEAEKLRLQLLAKGVKATHRSESVQEQAGFWVLIPPQKSREKAAELVERLKLAGITDLWRFTSGELAHAISLGLFRSMDRAVIRRKAVVAKGFAAEVRPRFREKSRHWLDFSFQGEPPLPAEAWAALLQEYEDAKQGPRPCDKQAG